MATDLFETHSTESKPVTVLGKTFSNDEERREYFREELRKKLPELKKMEGFPIGEDEDILNLSDPPYYTACPNPWLNDFINEWEKEKKELEKKGIRKADFEVTEPYAADVSEGKNNPIYMAHAYHTKVPHPAIMRYILHYTQPGDIVFDGFAGTGMTGVAANLCGSKHEVLSLSEQDAKIGVRPSICSDLSPIASLIAASYNLPFNPMEFEKKANAILEKVEREWGWMYETEIKGRKAKINYTVWSDVFICKNCREEIVLWDETVNLDKKSIKKEFPCPHCGISTTKRTLEKVWETTYDDVLGTTVTMNKKVPILINYIQNRKRGEQRVEDYDLELIEKTNNIKTLKHRTYKLKDGYNTLQPIQSNGIEFTHQFYTKRNLIYLSKIMELIDDNIFLKTWFTSALQRTTKLYKFTLNRKFGILTGTLYIPSLNVELNPYNILKRKIRDFTAIQYTERGNTILSINTATNLYPIEDNSLDYIFIDPPFGANIMYSELSSIWEGWINVQTNNKEEAIINPTQQKTLFDYQTLMNRSLQEFYRILKPGKWMTVEFSNTSASVWNSIQHSLQKSGFVVANVAALDKKQGSFKAVTTTTAVKQDLVITCFKPSKELLQKFSVPSNADNVWSFIDELLHRLPVHLLKDNFTTIVVERSPKILYDRLVTYYVQKGLNVPLNAQEFQKGLRERYIERDGMFFTAENAVKYEEKKSKAPQVVPMGLLVGNEEEGIEWLKRELSLKPKTYQELQPNWLQDLATPKRGDQLPELMQILDENFLKDDKGKWHKPDLEKEADLEQLRNKKLLREFTIYVEASKLKSKIKEVRLEALRAGFKQCYQDKDYQTIVQVGDRIPNNLLMEDEVLLQFYDIAITRI